LFEVADEEYDLSSKDVVSKPFDLTFPPERAGLPASAEVLLRLQGPDFRTNSRTDIRMKEIDGLATTNSITSQTTNTGAVGKLGKT
jgi:hypothetical protein